MRVLLIAALLIVLAGLSEGWRRNRTPRRSFYRPRPMYHGYRRRNVWGRDLQAVLDNAEVDQDENVREERSNIKDMDSDNLMDYITDDLNERSLPEYAEEEPSY